MPGALVLCPTRELAQQVASDAIDLVKHCRGLRVANVVGGMPYQLQIAKLQNANLVVATPGRLLDLQRSGQIKLDQIRFLVMDEADRMLDLGFADDLAEIHQLTAQRQQTMMFSATFAPRIQQLAMRVMHDNGARVQKVEIATAQEQHANIRQELYWADSPEHKRRLLDYWLRDPSIDQAIVFACTQVECEELAEDLQQNCFAAVSLHGALSQSVRNRRLGALRDGLAMTLVEIRDRRRLAEIEGHTRQPFNALTIDGLEPTRHFPPIAQHAPGRKGGAPRRGNGPRQGEPHRAGARAGFGAKAPFKAKSGFGAEGKGAGSYKNSSKPAPRSHAGRPAAPRAKAYSPAR